jgi:autotransporter-associated beta strand protein
VALSSWIAALFRRAPRSPRLGRSPIRRYSPTLELLEDRLAPAMLTVNTLADSIGGSQLSLRDAILAIDGGSYSGPAIGQVSGTFGSNDTILFQSGLNGTLSLTTANGPLVISSNLTITANPTLNAIAISGGTHTGVFEVTSTGTATIAGLTITNGKDSTNLFGGIYAQAGGALTVNGCTFVNNQSMGAGGGAILNAGTLTVTNSTFNNNSGVVGGAIDNISGATATLINCTISGNQATSGSGAGGGVANAGSLTLLNTLVAQNTSAGADPDVVGAFSSSGHNLIGNATGSTGLINGINGDQVGGAPPFTCDVTSGLATIENISNTAGLAVGQLVTDTAGAIPAGTVIAVLGSHSITLSQAATSSQTGDTFTSSVYANLGPLQNNGGGIQTMALLPTSCGIDAGANSDPVLTVPTVDQRGASRPEAGTVDIGAFEANELTVTNLNDSGAGSLRDALSQSNSLPGTVLIDFQAGLTGTISLTTARLEVVHDDWIRGPGAAQITVDGNLNFWCFGVDSQYTVGAPGLHVAIAGLTMTRGEQVVGISDSRGGAISYRNTSPFDCRLTVANCVIQNSVNGGIYAEDALSVINCQVINNTGQGIRGGSPLYVSNSWIAGNSSDGLSPFNDLVLANSTFSGNGTGTSGDGVYMGDNNATVTDCTFTANHGRGFVINYQDTVLLTNCTLVGNVGSDLLSIGGNAIPRNSIVDKLDTQNGFGTITSQGNNLFRSAVPSGMTVLASDECAPGLSTSNAFGGTLTSGKYYYVIGAVTSTGMLTTGDLPDTLNFSNMKVNLSWTAPVGITGVTGYKIYRGTALGGEKLIATVSAGTTSLTDTGAVGSSSVPLLLGALANNGGLAPTIAPTGGGSVYTRNKANPAFAPFLDEGGYLRNPILPGLGAFESAGSTPNTVSLSPASLVGIDQGLNYSQSIFASGGTGAGYRIGITAGALPPGLTLTIDGALAGTATTVGSFAFTVTGFDSAGNFGSKNYTLNVNPAPSIATSSLPAGNENAAYSTAILTTGGTAPFTWSYTGTLPSGITFDASTGTFGGTPPAGSAGTYNNIQVTATDSDGESTAPQTYAMVIDAVSLGALSFDQWTVNKTGFIGAIAATGTGALTLSVASGKLPAGMTASVSGGGVTFAGKPTVAGTYTFALKLTDSLGVAATQGYTIVINPATTFVWTGLGADANWTTPGNWSGAGAAPLAGYTLIFGPGVSQKTANNNFPSATQFAALRFQDSGYTITGNNLKLSAGISSTSTAGGTDTVALNVALTANETFTIAGATLIDVTGTLSGTLLGITKAGAGTLAYDSPAGNTYTGPTTVSGGTLQLNTSNQIVNTANVTVNVGAAFDLNGHDETIANLTLTGGAVTTGIGTLTLSGNVTSNAATPSATINGNLDLIGAAPTLTVNNGIAVNDLVVAASISAGSLTKLGLGTLVLSGANSSCVGTTKVSSGILDVQNSAALGSGPVVAILGTTLQLDDDGLTFANTLTLGSTGGATLKNLAGSNTWSGPITDVLTNTINVSAGTLTVSGGISGAGGITKAGAGTLAYDSPAGNTYTGLTTVSGGTLQLNTSNQIVDTTSVTVNLGAVFDLNGDDETFANLTLTGGAVDTGIGTLTLRGNVTSNAATPSATIIGNLDLIGATPTLTVNNGIAVNDLVIAASISAGSLTKLGLGTLVLSGANSSCVGTTKVSSGILDVANSAALGSGPIVAIIGTTVQLDGDGLTFANTLTLGSTGGATLKNLAGSNTWSGPITDALTNTINVSAGTLTVSGGISGAGGVTKTGTGTLLLPSASSYTGITMVSAGVLDVQTPAALGNNASMTVAAAGTLQIDGTGLTFSKTLSLSGTMASLNGSNTWSGNISTLAAASTVNIGAGQSLTLSGIISGAGGLTANNSGSGTLILTNSNTYTGATTIKAGIAVVQNKTALGSTVGATTVSSGATLQLQGGLTIAERITLNGVGAAGATGALESVAGANTWTGTISLASASTIAIDAGQLTISGIISGVGSLSQAGAGTLIVSALNTYSGGTTVSSGTLGGGGKIGALLVSSGATIAPSSTTTKILKTGNVAFSAGSTFAVTLNGTTAGTGYDQLSVIGTVNLAGATLNVNLPFTPALGSAFMLIQNDGTDAVVGAFAGLPQGATLLLNGMTFQISYVGGTGNDVVLTRIA